MSRSVPLTVAACLGVLVSAYALYVESMHGTEGYVAMCDISEHASCSKVLTSEFGKILSFSGLVPKDSPLDVPNALLGLGFYAAMLLHPVLPALAVLAAATFSVALSCYLAYILATVLHDFCAVCVCSYVINLVIFALAARRALEVRPAASAPNAKAKRA
jgi:vitamin-K-epoxide reductase (warfarin-sensitive)